MKDDRAIRLEQLRKLQANLCEIAKDIGSCFSTWILFTCGTMLVMVVFVSSVITFNAVQGEDRLQEVDKLMTAMYAMIGLGIAISRVYIICVAANGLEKEVRLNLFKT